MVLRLTGFCQIGIVCCGPLFEGDDNTGDEGRCGIVPSAFSDAACGNGFHVIREPSREVASLDFREMIQMGGDERDLETGSSDYPMVLFQIPMYDEKVVCKLSDWGDVWAIVAIRSDNYSGA